MSRTVARNASNMTMASIAQKVIAFLYFTLIARAIGAEGTGQYFFALSFTTIFVVFVDLGLTNVLVREASAVKEKVGEYLSSVLSMKLLLGVAAYIAAVFTINVFGYSQEIRYLVYLSGITMLFDSIHLSLYGALRALGDLRYEATAIVASQGVTLVLGSIFLWMHLPLIFLILAFTIPSALNATAAFIVLRKVYRIKPKLHRVTPSMKKFMRIAVPFAIAAVLARLYSYADSMILSRVAGDLAVGWYSIAYKITFAFQFIPLALVASLYPKFSEYFTSNKQKLAHLFEQGMVYLLLIAAPVAVGIATLAPDIILSIYTDEYANAILPLQILMSSLVFSFLSFPIGACLNACHRQTAQTVIVAITLVVNVSMNLWLIPLYGVVGAACAAVAGNAILAVAGYTMLPKIMSLPHLAMAWRAVRILLSAAAMGWIVYMVNTQTSFLLAIVAGAMSYPILLFVTKTITIQQVKDAKKLVRS